MKVRIVAFVVWAVAAASAMFWALRLGVTPLAAPASTVVVSTAGAPRGDLTRLFGAAAPRGAPAATVESALGSRFRLLGVAAPRQGGDRTGLALIAVDGKPARSYAVGATVEGGLLLQSVYARGARLGALGAPAQVTLELPALPPPATGSFAAARAAPPVTPPQAATDGAPVMPGAPVGLPMEAVPLQAGPNSNAR